MELFFGGTVCVPSLTTGFAFLTKDEQLNPGMMGIYDDSFI